MLTRDFLPKHFAEFLFLGGILGFIFAPFFEGLEWLPKYCLMLNLFLGFLRIEAADVMTTGRQLPQLLLWSLISIAVIPLMLFFISGSIPEELRLGLFLMAASCAGANAPLLGSLIGLRVLRITAFVILSSLGVIFILPLLIQHLFQTSIAFDFWEMAFFLSQIVIFPAIVGTLFRRFIPQAVPKIIPYAGATGTISMMVLIGGIVAQNQAFIQIYWWSGMTLWGLFGMCVIFMIRFGMGYVLPAADRTERWSNGLMFVIINNSLMTLVALEFFTPAVVWICLLANIPWILSFPLMRKYYQIKG